MIPLLFREARLPDGQGCPEDEVVRKFNLDLNLYLFPSFLRRVARRAGWLASLFIKPPLICAQTASELATQMIL